MDYHILIVSQNEPMLIVQGWWQSLDQIEEALSPLSNVGAVLDVIGRPEAFSPVVVTPIEQCVEGSRTSALFCSCLLMDIKILLRR